MENPERRSAVEVSEQEKRKFKVGSRFLGLGQSLLEQLHANTDLDQPDVVSVRPEVEVCIADHKATFSGRRRRLCYFENNRLNGGRPFENVVAKHLVGVDALFDVGEERIVFDGVGDDDAAMVETPEAAFPPKGGDTFADLSSFEVVKAEIEAEDSSYIGDISPSLSDHSRDPSLEQADP